MSGWTTTKLSAVTDLIARGIPPKYIESGGLRVVNQRCVRDHKIDYSVARRHDQEAKSVNPDRLLQVGDVLINSTGVGTLGRVAQVRIEPGEPTTVDTHVTIVRPRKGRFYPEFFGYMLVSIEGQLASAGEGASGQTELARSSISTEFDVSYPTSLDEQKQIVAILDEAFEGIAKATANAEKNLASAQQLISAILHATFLEQAGWSEFPLGSRVRFIDYRGKTPPKADQGVRLITAKNVKMGYIQRRPEEFVDPTAYDAWMTRGLPRRGDVLFTTEAPLGNIAQLDTDETVMIGQRLITMQPDETFISADFLKWLLMSSKAQGDIWRLASGATVQGIKAKLLKTIVLGAPRLEEQAGIVDNLERASDACNAVAKNYQAKQVALAELKQSLLHKAFTGQLTSADAIPA